MIPLYVVGAIIAAFTLILWFTNPPASEWELVRGHEIIMDGELDEHGGCYP